MKRKQAAAASTSQPEVSSVPLTLTSSKQKTLAKHTQPAKSLQEKEKSPPKGAHEEDDEEEVDEDELDYERSLDFGSLSRGSAVMFMFICCFFYLLNLLCLMIFIFVI